MSWAEAKDAALRWATGALVAWLAWSMQAMNTTNRELNAGAMALRETLIETRTLLQATRERQDKHEARFDRIETRLDELVKDRKP